MSIVVINKCQWQKSIFMFQKLNFNSVTIMDRYEEENGDDSDNETDPEQLLNEWLGELDNLTVVSVFLELFWVISKILNNHSS